MKEKLQAVWDAKWALINPLIILGGIYGGLFTPTEAAAVAAVCAFICGIFSIKSWIRNFIRRLPMPVLLLVPTMAIIGCATAFTKLLTIEQIPMKVTNVLVALSDSRVIILLLINVLLLIVGMVMDTTPAMMVLAPILLPVARSVGLSPIHFGLVMVVNLAIGFLTPPLGINLFVASRIGNTKLEVVLKDIPMFIATMLLCLMLITYIPAITETLPRLLGINL